MRKYRAATALIIEYTNFGEFEYIDSQWNGKFDVKVEAQTQKILNVIIVLS